MADVSVIARPRKDRLGEGPLWSGRENALYWVDILGKRLNRLSLATGAIDEWVMPEMIGWVIEREHVPGFVAGLRSGLALLSLDPFGIQLIATPEPDRPGNRMNDAKADAAGRIWAGTMPLNGDTPTGAFYRLDPDRTVTRVDDGYRIANGPAISADGAWLFHTDSGAHSIYRFAIRDDGALGSRELFAAIDPALGAPDGMTIDADGRLWVAIWGGGRVVRFTPDGRIEREIALPASQITSCTFSGATLDRMFITSASIGVDEAEGGALFEVDPGCRGLPTLRYGG